MSNLIDNYANEFVNKYSDSNFQINQGASVLIVKNEKMYFALAKEKSWKYNENQIPIVKFTGIGGTREKEEKIWDNLQRELKEEVGIKTENLYFPHIEKTIIVKNYDKNENIKFDDKISPLYVIDYKLPLRDDINNIKGKKYSCLQLFVYLASANQEQNILPEEEDNITGILKINNEIFERCLQGNFRINNTKDIINWKKKYTNIDEIIVNPKFTPMGIRDAGLSFEKILNIIKRR